MRFSSYLFRILLAVLIVLGLLICFIPRLTSTNWGREKTLLLVNSLIPGHFEVDSWQLHWKKPQVLEEVVLKDAKGQTVLDIQHLKIEASLWSLLTQQMNIEQVSVQEMNANVKLAQGSWTNFKEALGFSKEGGNPLVSSFQFSHVNIDIQLFANEEPTFLSSKGKRDYQELKFAIQSPLVNGGFKGYIHEGAFTLLEPALFDLSFSPQFIQQATQSRLAPETSMAAQLTFHNLSFPLALLSQPHLVDFCECGFKVEAAIGQVDVTINPLGMINIQHLEAELASKAKDPRMHFKWTGYAEVLQKPLQINYQRLFVKPTDLTAFLQKPKFQEVSAVVPSSK